jgi:hypothetical protein
MITGGDVWPCVLESSKHSTDDDVTVFEGEYCLNFNSGLTSPEMEIVVWSVETLDMRFSLVIPITVTATPPCL